MNVVEDIKTRMVLTLLARRHPLQEDWEKLPVEDRPVMMRLYASMLHETGMLPPKAYQDFAAAFLPPKDIVARVTNIINQGGHPHLDDWASLKPDDRDKLIELYIKKLPSDPNVFVQRIGELFKQL